MLFICHILFNLNVHPGAFKIIVTFKMIFAGIKLQDMLTNNAVFSDLKRLFVHSFVAIVLFDVIFKSQINSLIC